MSGINLIVKKCYLINRRTMNRQDLTWSAINPRYHEDGLKGRLIKLLKKSNGYIFSISKHY